MINIDFNNGTYVCPYCGHAQAYTSNSHRTDNVGYFQIYSRGTSSIPEKYKDNAFRIHTFECSNVNCGKVCVTAVGVFNDIQFDILPKCTFQHFPDYIPAPIREDYEEACTILNDSPKASATLFRRCLQGMIHDYWGIKNQNLNAEITSLKDKIPSAQWRALNGLRQIGNIGAHMENDVNIIIDIEPDEALKLQKLIELLMEKWYINRHDEEQLFADLVGIADEKKEQRNETRN